MFSALDSGQTTMWCAISKSGIIGTSFIERDDEDD
jgi:hypothetical protein